MPRILFLYATDHSGHKRAADAIQKSLLFHNPHLETSSIGFFSHHYPILGPFLFKLYVDLMRSVPNIWDYLYNSEDIASLTKELGRFFASFNVSKVTQILSKTKPDVIVCTQAIPCSFIAHEKKKGEIRIPLIAVITDFVANPYWPNHDVDCYCVPDEEIKLQLMKKNINEKRIYVTGIPVDNSFIRKIPKYEARAKLGLNPYMNTILMMGGNQGLGKILKAVKKLIKSKNNLQFIIATGYNEKLYKKLKKVCSRNKNILVLGHQKNVSRLMDAADFLISKPGGLTSSEALVKLLPMIILSPLPGQEQKNAFYLKKHGVAELCKNVRNLSQIVVNFYKNKNKIIRFQRNALAISHPYASNQIAEQIIKFINHKNIAFRYQTHH
ncbi:MAG: glycosyltransferase [Elusimicrobia bacterium]|nr:glycosyltransferase [Elusimicrobiota bacterium]